MAKCYQRGNKNGEGIMSNAKFQMSNQSRSSRMGVDQCQNQNAKIWHLSIGISIDIWVLKFVIKDTFY